MNSAENLLAGQVAVVTGGGHGIGSAISHHLARLGAQVIITGRNKATLETTASDIRKRGGQCMPFECDVRQLSSVESLAAHVQGTHQRCDIVVNNAGIGTFNTPLHQLPPDQFDTMMETNLRGPYYVIRAFAPMIIAA
jgi:NAD(P)-dependent dehydrogenase (short-subunit alcohol dehydrogenase family)